MTGNACPGCDAPMQRRAFPRKPVGDVELDFCFACHGVWFDAFESAQLTPGAVIHLFREIHEHDGTPGRPARDRMPCPRCRVPLKLTHDVQRTQRIVYHRCEQGHGRFSSFLQFLREKQFVRDLNLAEIDRLRATVRQVRCSGCGAPVDVQRDARCAYCRAPLAILDADAVGRTLQSLAAEERRRTTVDPTAVMEAMLAGQRIERRVALAEGRANRALDLTAVDLVSGAIGLLLDS